MITHNMQSALELGNRTIMMNNGQIIMDTFGEERKRSPLQICFRNSRKRQDVTSTMTECY